MACVAGLGGMRDHDGKLTFAPRLPRDLSRLAFRLCARGHRVKVEVKQEGATYSLDSDGSVELSHHGERFTLASGEPVTLPLPGPTDREPPRQPPGCEPRERGGDARARG
jgi:alpha,alpha-trehalose phosphorylase